MSLSRQCELRSDLHHAQIADEQIANELLRAWVALVSRLQLRCPLRQQRLDAGVREQRLAAAQAARRLRVQSGRTDTAAAPSRPK